MSYIDLKSLLETIDIEVLEDYVAKSSTINIENRNDYITQINNAISFTNENISKSFPDKEDFNKIWMCISHLTQTYRHIYFEMGLCTGIKLGHDLHTK